MSAAFSLLLICSMEFNSDLLVPEAIFRDLFVLKTPMSGWNFSSALFLFPDWILYFSLRALSDNLRVVLLLYASLQTWMVYWVIDAFDRTRSLALFTCWMLLFLAIFSGEWMVYSLPVHHGGAFIVGLFFAQWYLRKPSLNAWNFFALSVIGALATASDLFFGLQTLAPLGLYSMRHWQRKSESNPAFRKHLALGFVILILTLVISKCAFALMHSQPLHFSALQFGASRQTLQNFAHYVIGFKLNLMVFALAFWLAWKERKSHSLYAWLLLSLPITMLAILMLNLWVDPSNTRYLLLFPFFVCLVLAKQILELALAKQRRLRVFATVAIIFATLSTIHGIRSFVRHWDKLPLSRPYPEDFACFDKVSADFALQNGFADYWLAKPVSILSQSHPNLLQVDNHFNEYKWLNNSRWSETTRSRNFILYNTRRAAPDAQAILNKWGAPEHLQTCGQIEIWIYDRNLLADRGH